MKINLVNIPSKYRSLIKTTVDDFIKVHRINPSSALNIEFTSKENIKSLNKKYRQVDQATDVLSFPIWKNKKNIPKGGEICLGDIIICPEMTDINKDLAVLINHSLNHLVGKHH